jgi:LacI family transcriptional regulator, gluconate utilization system Gnt-I transcriptional repressor
MPARPAKAKRVKSPARKRRAESTRARMADVASLADVSMITVSRALRTPDRVAKPTRERIEAAMRQVGYVPDLVAASLASRRSRVVAMVVPTIASSIFSDTVQGMADLLRRRGYQLIIGEGSYDQVQTDSVVEALLGRRPDGLILTGSRHPERARRLIRDSRIPVVETWELPGKPIDSAVGFSNRGALRAMAETMVEAGYRHIAFIGPTQGDTRAWQRRQGYADAMARHGRPAILVETPQPPSLMQHGAEAIARLAVQHPEVDAACFTSDGLAIGALFECHRRGWAVPGRLAIAGFGDFELAAAASPALTTVVVPRYRIGEEAGRLILGRIEGEIAPGHAIDLGFEIIRRESA